MADPHRPPPNPGFANTDPAYPNEKTTIHIREARLSTNWLAYVLAAAVVVVIIAILVFSGGNTPATQPAGGNNVTIEAPATAPAPVPDAIPAPDAPAATTPDATAPAAPDPVAPAPETTPDAGTAAPAPAGN